MNAELREVLFLDIETVAITDSYQSLDERFKSLWARKASYLRKDESQTDEYLFNQRAGIYAEFGKVICIGVGKFYQQESGDMVLKTKAYYGNDEKSLLLEFKGMLDKMDGSVLKLCAHNGKEFDFPYLCRRMLINEINLPQALNLAGKKSWEVPHIDTMDMWKFGDYKNFTSLELLAAVFNIPSSKGGIDGSQVNEVYYKESDLPRIKDYCLRDVVVLSQIFLKMRGIAYTSPLTVQEAP
ncbi:MAG TPA: 3'-5' exonuclease [Cyclobacteriaceae bacterium]|jgi:DNA polymerase elongation subunit (family B)|nr:3'-5' exonuclease [Cyclobacteriaceae bacterium]